MSQASINAPWLHFMHDGMQDKFGSFIHHVGNYDAHLVAYKSQDYQAQMEAISADLIQIIWQLKAYFAFRQRGVLEMEARGVGVWVKFSNNLRT